MYISRPCQVQSAGYSRSSPASLHVFFRWRLQILQCDRAGHVEVLAYINCRLTVLSSRVLALMMEEDMKAGRHAMTDQAHPSFIAHWTIVRRMTDSACKGRACFDSGNHRLTHSVREFRGLSCDVGYQNNDSVNHSSCLSEECIVVGCCTRDPF